MGDHIPGSGNGIFIPSGSKETEGPDNKVDGDRKGSYSKEKWHSTSNDLP